MAERDGLSSIREAGRYTRSLAEASSGSSSPTALANDRLEALRRIAIFAWHHGWNVPKSELAAFFGAGFTSDQFELIQNSLGQARAARRRRTRPMNMITNVQSDGATEREASVERLGWRNCRGRQKISLARCRSR